MTQGLGEKDCHESVTRHREYTTVWDTEAGQTRVPCTSTSDDCFQNSVTPLALSIISKMKQHRPVGCKKLPQSKT